MNLTLSRSFPYGPDHSHEVEASQSVLWPRPRGATVFEAFQLTGVFPDQVALLTSEAPVVTASRARHAKARGALARHLEQARQIVRTIETAPPYLPMTDPVLSEGFQQIRWFPPPGEALAG